MGLRKKPASALGIRAGPALPRAKLSNRSASTFDFALAPTGTGHGRKLANLVKMYTDEAKYSSENDDFTFKLTIFHDICDKANVS